MSFEKKWSWNFKYLTRKWALKIAKIAKMSKKNCSWSANAIHQKMHLEKCRMAVKLIFVTSGKQSKLPTLWQGYQILRFLANNFSKSLYFQKRICSQSALFKAHLLIYIITRSRTIFLLIFTILAVFRAHFLVRYLKFQLHFFFQNSFIQLV